jgi:hypothetical protein
MPARILFLTGAERQRLVRIADEEARRQTDKDRRPCYRLATPESVSGPGHIELD